MFFSEKFIFLLLISFLGVTLIAVFFFWPAGKQSNDNTIGDAVETPTICFKDTCLQVETASTPAQRSQGLMGRERLAEDRGMLFVFPRADAYSFWMKSTLIPLDIIWLDKDWRVVHIEEAEPCQTDVCPSFRPKSDALYVLETNQGFSNKNSINVGDAAIFKGDLDE